MALGLLAALAYGGSDSWTVRAERSWRQVGGQGPLDLEGLQSALSEAHRVLVNTLDADENRAGLAIELVDAVFKKDLGDPIPTVEELARAQVWTDWSELAAEIAELVQLNCPKIQ